MQTAEVWVSFAPLCSSGFHPQMFVVFKLLTVLTKAGRKPLQCQLKHMDGKGTIANCISCALKCLPHCFVSLDSSKVKDLKFPITAGRNARGSNTRKRTFWMRACFEKKLFCSIMLFEYAIVLKRPTLKHKRG